MIADAFLWIVNRTPPLRRALWRTFFDLLATRFGDVGWWTLMNYGYAEPGCRTQAVTLEPADEPERYPIALYRHVATLAPIAGRDVLEVGSGRGGGASYIARYLMPRRMVGVDLSGKAVWTFKGIERSLSTPAIKDGLLYVGDYTGRLFCLDAKTGKEYWKFDTKGHIWGSPLVADGKVYLGNEEGELFILAEGKEMKQLGSVEFPSPVMGTPVAANGVLYITTHTHLYAFKQGAQGVAKN
jgi:outer membrane protein assembly factor BamB